MKIKTNPDKYFHQAIQLLSPMPPFNKLKNRELLVYGELLKLKHSGTEVLLYAKNRDKVADNLDMSHAMLRNVFSKFRKLGLLVENELDSKYVVKYLQPLKFDFYESKDD
jgi:hypothetical protein